MSRSFLVAFCCFLNVVTCAPIVFAQSPVTAQAASLDDFFPTDHVLDVQITVAEKDWDTLRLQSRNFFEALNEKRREAPIPGPYTYVPASVKIDGREFPNIGLRKKGFIGSQSKSRPSLKVKLNFVDKSANIDGLKNLTFNNNKQDISLLSQYMGYRLFNAAGSPASRCSLAKVTVNGEELGIYSHVESIKSHFCKREFGTDQGTLYEGTVVDFYDDWEGSFENKFGDDAVGREQIRKLTAALQQPLDDKFESKIGELVDLDSFYTFWAVEGLLGFWDGYSGNNNNFFVYLNPKTNKFHFVPWGLDAAFEKYSQIDRNRRSPLSVKTKGLVAHKLYQLESCRKRYAKTLKALLDKHWDEEQLLAEADRIEAMVKPDIGASQDKFSWGRTRFREFVRNRRSDIEKEIEQGMPLWTKTPNPPFVINSRAAKRMQPNSLWNAAKSGNIDAIKKQLAKGVDINAKDPGGTPALMMAALGGQTETAEFLISKGADVNAKSGDGGTALHASAFLGRVKIVKLLLATNADVTIRNNRGESAMDACSAAWSAQMKGIVEWVARMVGAEIDIETVKANRPKVVELLRQHIAKDGQDAKPIKK